MGMQNVSDLSNSIEQLCRNENIDQIKLKENLVQLVEQIHNAEEALQL